MFSASKTAGPSGYNISRSVRLRSSASAYLNRTPASASNRQKYTLSFWFKRGTLSTNQALFSASDGTQNNEFLIYLGTGDTINIQQTVSGSSAGQISCVTNAVFRDPSAWYHMVLAIDTTQATSTNRLLLYINGVAQTFSSYSVGSSINTWVDNTNPHALGKRSDASLYFDGYMTEVNFIDGQALTPSSFGSTNATTGVWQPAKYTGTYGTNGFYLNFSDNSAATAAAIGKDYSGNGNNWTPNNISVTAGVTYDSMVDVPTPYADGSTGRGNYCVLNPLDKNANTSISSGNLNYAYVSGTGDMCRASFGMSSGKWYWEITITAANPLLGIAKANATLNFYPGYDANGWGYYGANGQTYNNGVGTAYGATYTTNDVIGVAFDADAGTLVFYKNNVSQGTAFSGLTSGPYFPAIGYGNTSPTAVLNFGQRPFSYTPPSGFKALNTYNLPASTITNGGKYMAATTYTGTGASQSVTNAGSFKPDLVWVKSRSAATDHKLTDSVRGTTKALISDTTGAETTDTNGLTAFGSAGFTVGSDTTYNNNTATYVGWQWQAGQGTTSSNTSGSITSTVSVNATAGFSVVTYTGTGANATVGHGLGVAPKMIIVKNRSAVQNWPVYHTTLTGTSVVALNLTGASSANIAYWNNTNPTSTVFSVGTDATTNGSTNNMVAYCWAEIAGFSKFGSYTGNGSTDGTFVYLGFRPRYIMWKRSDSTGDWIIQDTSRATYNASDTTLYANLSAAESVGGGYPIDVLSNGFKMRTAATYANASGGTYIYAAFAENPFANALAR